jgi:hypothetical protein
VAALARRQRRRAGQHPTALAYFESITFSANTDGAE